MAKDGLLELDQWRRLRLLELFEHSALVLKFEARQRRLALAAGDAASVESRLGVELCDLIAAAIHRPLEHFRAQRHNATEDLMAVGGPGDLAEEAALARRWLERLEAAESQAALLRLADAVLDAPTLEAARLAAMEATPRP